MPKFLVGIISAAFALVIGFASGAILTRTDNLRMEKLVISKKVVEEKVTELRTKVSELESKNNVLVKEISQLKNNNQKLRDNLLEAYEAKSSKDSSIE